MGLDMYAYSVKAELIDNSDAALATGQTWETDIPVYKLARRAVGFVDWQGDEIEKMKPEDLSQYHEKLWEANRKAEQEGFINKDFHYWRKFNALHGWMENLYYNKGGKSGSFNCVTLRLTKDDLDLLEQDMQLNRLTPKDGFFFGDQSIEPEDYDNLKLFIRNARAEIKDGYAIVYDSWW